MRAPGDLELVRAFVNTWDDGERLSGPEALGDWLRSHGLAGAAEGFTREDLARALALREALRALLYANNGGTLDPAAVAAVNRAGERATLVVALDEHGAARLRAARPGLDGALGRLLGAVSRAQAEGTWARLKACAADDCRWAFYDRSRNHSRTWCEMRVCGNREKARAYRARRH
jgi:predicted RNA-binding Zn ribbon-like protein